MLSLQHTATDFELQNAIHLAELSDIAYHNGDFIQSQVAHLYNQFAFIDIHPMSGFDTELFVVGNDKTIVIAFRGTEADSLEDWVNNLDNRPFAYSSGNVHRGFWEALDQVWSLTLEKIQSFRTNNQTIWLTGHSQGGALAMLAGKRLLDSSITIQGIYTYGQPKLGDMLFVANYDSFLKNKTFRIYNEGDSVIESPPKLYHAGIGVKLQQEGGFEIQYNATIFEQSGGDFLSLLDSIFDYATDGLQVHKMQEYIKRLQKSY
ncbi:MAG: lipase family protein [Raineya sp.]|jgi:triacylglycerol lipase|nr:lipase family protein [Raineya sp.]